MSALGNLDHERFCQALHKRVWAGEKRSTARTAAYRDTMYSGDNADDSALAANARRLANRKDILARLKELAEFSAKLAGVDSGWALVKLKALADDIEGFNLDHYLGPPNDKGLRFYDLSLVPPEKMRLITELAIEDITTIVPRDGAEDEIRRTRKVKLKGPAKVDLVGPLALMARIAGWEAPKKIAPVTAEGNTLTLEDLVGASMLAKLAKAQAAPDADKTPQAA